MSGNLIFQTNYIFFQGLADCVLALGFEKMEKGSLGLTVSLIYSYLGIVVTLWENFAHLTTINGACKSWKVTSHVYAIDPAILDNKES